MNQEEEIARLAAELARVTRERDTERASIVAFMRQQKVLLESPMQMLLGGIIAMAAQSRGTATKPLSIDVDAIAARIERGDHRNVCVDPGPTETERCAKIADDVAARFTRPDGEDEVTDAQKWVAREIASKIRGSK